MCIYIFINIDINIDMDIGIDIEIISLGPLWVAIGSDNLVTMNMPKIWVLVFQFHSLEEI